MGSGIKVLILDPHSKYVKAAGYKAIAEIRLRSIVIIRHGVELLMNPGHKQAP